METRRGRGRGPTDREHLGPLPSRTLWLRARPCSRKPLGYNWRIPRSPSTDSLRRPWGERPTFGPRKSTDGRRRGRGTGREREGDGERERREGTKNSRALPLSVSLFLPLFLSQWRMPPPLSVLLPFPPLTFDARGRRVDVQGVSGRMMFLWPSSEHFIVIMLSGLVWLRPPRFLLCSFLLRICFLCTEGVGDLVSVM